MARGGGTTRGSIASGQEAAALENMRLRRRWTIEAEVLAEKRWRHNVRWRQQHNAKTSRCSEMAV